ncbi:MAG: hypothetical protein V7K69_07495 [Nostoc sp.]|uniref:hypothetical protein n=1 Tax=Nostoc sp. TaxID=1180 RepID=UPI002FF918B7
MKLILPLDLVADIEPHLPPDTEVVTVDVEGNLYGDNTDAEVYFSWFLTRSPTLHKIIAAAPALRWHHAPYPDTNLFGKRYYPYKWGWGAWSSDRLYQ